MKNKIPISREYKIYKEEEFASSIPKTIYEKMCNAAGKAMKIDPDAKTATTLKNALEFAHLRTTPRGVASLALLFTFIVCFPTLILILTKTLLHLPGLSFGYGMIILLVALPVTFYLYIYPTHLKKRYEVETGAEIVTMTLYMAIYMRNIPNLEGAVKFASENISGPLAYELRKLMWDVEVGNYVSIQSALIDYTNRWSTNKDFVEAVETLITSLKQTGDRRITLLDEAVKIILQGSRESAKHFNQSLKMPVLIVHALGIILPVMGLVLFPIVAVFLNVGIHFLLIGYDILLPIILYFVIKNILEMRPPTFSKIDIKESPDIPPEGKFRVGKSYLPAWPFGFLVGFVIVSLGLIFYISERGMSIMAAFLLTGGVAFGFGIYFILSSFQSLGVRERTRQIEQEFADAMFQIGNHISSGIPIEMSIEQSLKRIGNLKIKDLFGRTIKNMKSLGMTFEQAMFDKEYGSVRYYPSRLVKSVMKTISESAKKGASAASLAMLSISMYVKNLHQTQEEVQEELNDTLTSLKFQAYFLSPMISGIIVTLALIILKILAELSTKLTGTDISVPFLNSFKDMSISPFQFVIVVAIYMVEVSFILSMFINGIESGQDNIGFKNTAGYSLIVGFIVFVVCFFATYAMFGPLISGVVG